LLYVTVLGRLLYVTVLGRLLYVTVLGRLLYVTVLGKLLYVIVVHSTSQRTHGYINKLLIYMSLTHTSAR